MMREFAFLFAMAAALVGLYYQNYRYERLLIEECVEDGLREYECYSMVKARG